MHGPIAAIIRWDTAPIPIMASIRRFNHAGQGAAPSCVRGGDDPGLRIGDENGCTIGTCDSERQTRPFGYQRVRAGSIAARPIRFDDQRVTSMHLPRDAKRSCIGIDHREGAAPIFGHALGIIAAGATAVERMVQSA